LPPGKDLIVHTTEFVSGEYLHDPAVVLNLGESASTGTGTMISTLLAVDRRLNCDLAYRPHTDRQTDENKQKSTKRMTMIKTFSAIKRRLNCDLAFRQRQT